jgi:IS5 family transposase
MNDTLIVTVYVILDDLLRAMGHRTDCRAQTSDSEVLTVGVIAACQFQNHHERALCILRALGYLSGPLSVSRFNRRFHALAHRLSDAVDLLAALLTTGTIFVIDSMPLPVCRRARAWRCRKVRGAEYCGYCAAKKETGALWAAFGWRLHLVITAEGIPVSFDLLPASYHDLTPVHELMERLPSGACVYADKGYNSAEDEAWIEGETGIRIVPRRRENMAPNTLAETFALQRYRGRVETVHSQLEAWGVQRLHARTHEGWLCKVLASLFALLCINAD